MATINTIWPTSPPPPAPVKLWISEFYKNADSKEEEAGIRLAALFAPEGEFHGLRGKQVGISEIAASRAGSWGMQESRSHRVLRVYTLSPTHNDILVLGSLEAHLSNGRDVEEEFVARIVLEGDTTTDPKAALYRVYSDSAPWIAAMKG